MTRWKVRTAGGLTLLGLLFLAPHESRTAGAHDWFSRKEKRPKAPPSDCKFGYYGTGWRAWPEGCETWSGSTDLGLPFATPYASPVAPLPQPWSIPTSSLSPQTVPNGELPPSPPTSPRYMYREYLIPQRSASPDAVPATPYGAPQFPLPNSQVPTQTLPPGAILSPKVSPPSGRSAPSVPPAPAVPERQFPAPAPHATRGLSQPTTMMPTPRINGGNVVPASAWTRNANTPSTTAFDSAAKNPTARYSSQQATQPFSSIPKSLAAPTQFDSAALRRQGPVMLLPPE